MTHNNDDWNHNNDDWNHGDLDLAKMGHWPTYAKELGLKLNRIHAAIRRKWNEADSGFERTVLTLLEKIMSELSDLQTAIANNKKEVAEAIEKMNATLETLATNATAATDLEALRTGVRAAITEIEGSSKALDDKFGTAVFVPSTQPPA